MITEFLLVGVLTLIISYIWSQRRPNNFPPGPPWGIPFLGHILQLGLKPYLSAVEWIPKYGPIVGLNIAGNNVVVLSDYELIKEALNETTFTGRPAFPFVTDRSGGTPEGIIFTDGRKWQEQRRFALRRLRDFGFGTRSMEAIVQDEVQELIENFKKGAGAPISTTNKFNVAVVNALWTIVAGERFKQDDEKLGQIIKLLTESLKEENHLATLVGLFPRLAKYTPDSSSYKKLIKVCQDVVAFVQPYVDSHLKTWQHGNPRDFIDSYFDEIQNTTDPNSSFYKDDDKTGLKFALFDLFLAGAETTSTTLTWIFLLLASYPETQAKLAAEIDAIVGNSRLPSLEDRPMMPYTEAVIHEVMRFVTLVPLSVAHATTEDVNFHGYFLPKNTLIMPNLHEVHHNVKLWGDPACFRPERFLSEDEAVFVKHDGFVPFSVGKRACLGEKLARDELFLFTSSLFQTFSVGLDGSEPRPTLEPTLGGVLMPQPHKLILTCRH